jgi:hypothetical protein
VRHQAGEKHLAQLQENYRVAGVQAHCAAFIEDMAGAYEWADLVICRAGALTVAELAASGVASVLVPFPHAVDDHQTANARFLSLAGGAILLPQSELTPEAISRCVNTPLLSSSKWPRRRVNWPSQRRRQTLHGCARNWFQVKHKVKSIHFVGIGGAGMSGIAEVLANLGFTVSGSDLAENSVTRRLAGLGVRTVLGHAAENVAGADAVVVSSAVKSDNPEVIAARNARCRSCRGRRCSPS